MSLEKIINSGKRILSTSLLVGTLAISPLLSGCGKDDDQKTHQRTETQAPGISENLQEQWPIWEPSDLEIKKYRGPVAVYDKQLNIKPEFYSGPMPLEYESSGIMIGLDSTLSKIIRHKFEDFSNYFIYDGLNLVGAVSVNENNKMVAEAEIDEINAKYNTDGKIIYNPNFKAKEFHYSGGLLVFHCESQFERASGIKQEETNCSGKKQRDYFFILPSGFGK